MPQRDRGPISPAPREVLEWTVRAARGRDACAMRCWPAAAARAIRRMRSWRRERRRLGPARAARRSVLRDGDRVEIYRPLRVDPKVARRERFRKQGARAAGLFAQRRPGAKRRLLSAAGCAVARDHRLQALDFGGALLVVEDFALALVVRRARCACRSRAWPWLLARAAVVGPRRGDFASSSAFFFAASAASACLRFFASRSLSVPAVARAGVRRGVAAVLPAQRRAGVARPAARPAGALQDVLGGDVRRRRLVAEDLAAVLVDATATAPRRRSGRAQAARASRAMRAAFMRSECSSAACASASLARPVARRARASATRHVRKCTRVQSVFWSF